ncbi:MAG TPA: type II secretion system protein GspG [Candidatus Polarisedimenticolaceae bacterium]|nr:type II secretion system protein GspG [Candidatus Polarisedimenticolaceae bacterium]
MKAALILGLLLAAVPQPSIPTDAERARWTMDDMRTLATAIEAYAVDHKTYPVGSSLAAIVATIEPIYVSKAPTRDAWGHDFLYTCKDGQAYTIVSTGADGVADPASWSRPAKLDAFTEDAVLTSGKMDRSWAYR